MFGFPKANRAEIGSFHRNFLRSVIFQVKFEDNSNILEKREDISKLFSDLLPRKHDRFEHGVQISFKGDQTPILNPITEKDTGFELRSIDGQKVLSIVSDNLTYTVGGKIYVDFETFKSELTLIKEVLKLGKITNVNRIAVRKLNIIEFEIPEENKAAPMELLGSVLNPELFNVSSLPESSLGNIKQNISTINYVKDDYRLNLRYGLVVSPSDEKNGHILLDIDLFNLSNVEAGNIFNVTETINSEIFNVFNWALSEESSKYLKGV